MAKKKNRKVKTTQTIRTSNPDDPPPQRNLPMEEGFTRNPTGSERRQDNAQINQLRAEELARVTEAREREEYEKLLRNLEVRAEKIADTIRSKGKVLVAQTVGIVRRTPEEVLNNPQVMQNTVATMSGELIKLCRERYPRVFGIYSAEKEKEYDSYAHDGISSFLRDRLAEMIETERLLAIRLAEDEEKRQARAAKKQEQAEAASGPASGPASGSGSTQEKGKKKKKKKKKTPE